MTILKKIRSNPIQIYTLRFESVFGYLKCSSLIRILIPTILRLSENGASILH